jgi:5-methylcytosine-specific restriction protein A
MPYKPKKKIRPWIRERKPFQDAPTNKFYWSTPWRKLRKLKISQNPSCEQCKKNGKLTEATMVDHINPINPTDPYNTTGYGEPLDINNLQSLCRRCHSIKMGRSKKEKNAK